MNHFGRYRDISTMVCLMNFRYKYYFSLELINNYIQPYLLTNIEPINDVNETLVVATTEFYLSNECTILCKIHDMSLF